MTVNLTGEINPFIFNSNRPKAIKEAVKGEIQATKLKQRTSGCNFPLTPLSSTWPMTLSQKIPLKPEENSIHALCSASEDIPVLWVEIPGRKLLVPQLKYTENLAPDLNTQRGNLATAISCDSSPLLTPFPASPRLPDKHALSDHPIKLSMKSCFFMMCATTLFCLHHSASA